MLGAERPILLTLWMDTECSEDAGQFCKTRFPSYIVGIGVNDCDGLRRRMLLHLPSLDSILDSFLALETVNIISRNTSMLCQSF